MMNPTAVEKAVAKTSAKSRGSSTTDSNGQWGAKIQAEVRYCAAISKAIL